MTKKIFYILVFFSFLPFACKRTQKQPGHLDSYAPQVVKAHGYVVPKDSIAKPKVVPAGKPRVVRAGKPQVTFTNTNVHPAGKPKIVKAGTPKRCTPGKDGFSLPKIVPAIDSPFMAGTPEIVVAKEAHTNDHNPHNFSSFGKLQGLKSNSIRSLLEDTNGNLWIGTDGAGATRYDGRNFTHYTKNEGLSQDHLRCMLEDRAGNIWFGTLNAGLTKFDGKHFTHYTEKQGLSNNWINCMIEDNRGNLWIGTGGGVNKYDGKNFTHFTEKEGLSNNNVVSMLKAENGNLWFGTYSGGINIYDGSFTHLTEKEGLSSNLVLGMRQDKEGNFWIGTQDGGANKYNGESFTHFTEKEGLSSKNVFSVIEDKGGNLWFGTSRNGLYKYDKKNFTHFAESESLNNYEIWCILEDKKGNLWIGTVGGGLNKYNGKRFTHFTKKEGLPGNIVTSILEDKKGNLWFGCNGGVSRYDGNSFTNFTENQGLVHNLVWTMKEDKRGDIWIGTIHGVSKYDGTHFTNFTEKEGLYNGDVRSFLDDRKGNMWIGAYGGISIYDGNSFTHFTENQGLNKDSRWTLSMHEDKNGNLWLGTMGGLTKDDGTNITHFTEKEGLGNNIMRSIIEDNTGNLWFGTKKGIVRFDSSHFTHFAEREGLSNDVSSAHADKKGKLWFGTANGLSKLNIDKLNAGSARLSNGLQTNYLDSLAESKLLFTHYSYEDGFSGIGVNGGKTICEASDGTIWIGANERLTAFHPGEESRDTIAPNIQLTGLALFNETIAWQNFENRKDTAFTLGNGIVVHDFRFDSVNTWYGVPQQLSLGYKNNNLSFQFVGITLRSPKKVKYRYKLEGLDENWSALTDRSEASYGNLPIGNYTFKVKAMNGDGYWSKELNYAFTIRPPWWKTWWFRLATVIGLVSLFYGLIRWRLHQKFRLQLERTEKEKQLAEMGMKTAVLKQQTTELEMQALRAQMNPHFIFNCLSSINMFILENNRLQASDYLSKFSRLVRLILQHSQQSFIPLERELEALRLYLELESLRFEQRFEYRINVSEDVDITTVKVPPLIIQPYAENAIWHGLMPKKEKGRLEIELFQKDESLFCKIIDDGIGRRKAEDLKSKPASEHKSIGMQITANRMQILQSSNGSESPVTIIDLVAPDGSAAGTEVIIKLPMIGD